MQNALPKNIEYNILIFPQDYINLFINSDLDSAFSDSETEYYERIIDFFKKIDPEILLVDDFDLFTSYFILLSKLFKLFILFLLFKLFIFYNFFIDSFHNFNFSLESGRVYITL